ncbi:phenylacetate--CoA ligase family protein [Actinomadura nitritigenes]|uniref:phenylacetate--CoA ligase family protein n=1 Tax=Actinomadura nitritigenes TaxID=134602 RepID=UPI003D92A576
MPISSTSGTSVREIAGKLMARTRWTPERLAAHQRERLDELVRHAVAGSPYYRKLLGADAADGGTGVRLRDLPTLTKATLMEHFDEIITEGPVRRDAAGAHLAGPRPGRPFGPHRVFATSGSTGRPGIFVYSQAEFAVWTASHLRMMACMGITPDMRAVGIGAPSPAHLSRQMMAEVAAGRPGDAPALSVATPMPYMVTALDGYRPDAISTFPSTAALLAEEQLAGRLRIAPTVVAVGAEVLTEDMRRRIRDAWGIEPRQAYLTGEAPLIASACTGEEGMRLWEDLVLVEVVDADDRPVAPGVAGDKVLITNLVNRVQPLIRYELTDLVTLAPGPDRAGDPFRRLSSVEGRSDDVITLPAPGGGDVAVQPVLLRAPFTAFREVMQYQVTYDGHGLTGRVVLREGSPSDTADRLRAELTRQLREAGAVPPPIAIVPTLEIGREGGHAAKFKLIRHTGR